MSLDYEFTPIDVDIISHPKAFGAGPEAMGLWLWGQAHCKLHRTEGRIARAAALAAWGGKRNIMLAKRLALAGLWILREDGDWDVWNHEKKAPKLVRTPAAERTAKWRGKRHGDVTRDGGDASRETSPRHHRDVSCDVSASTSISLSSGSDLSEIASAPPVAIPERIKEPILDAPELTPLLRAMVAQIGEPSGVTTLDADHEWLTFAAHSAREARPITPAAWRFWLCNAVKFAKRDRIREQGRGPTGNRHVQSSDNRAWTIPKDMP